MAEFAERHKKMNETALQPKYVESWRRAQKSLLQFHLKHMLSTLEWAAKCGFLSGEFDVGGFWGADTTRISNMDISIAEEETKNIAQELFEKYGIEVIRVQIIRGAYIQKIIVKLK